MKLAIIVTEYPKTTETFILRDILAFVEKGADVRIYHLSSYRKNEILHDFAKPTKALAHHKSIISGQSFWQTLRNFPKLVSLWATIIRVQSPEPVIMAKSLGISIGATSIAKELKEWGAEHVHAEFAGHPATAAWVIHRLTNIPYSVSCRGHDVYRTQRLLAEKFAPAVMVRSVSNYTKNFIAERVNGFDKTKLRVIHSSVDISGIPKLGPTAGDGFNILYVGSLHIRKGIDILLNALLKLPDADWTCRIIGDGPERENLESLCQSLGLAKRVTFEGKQRFDYVTAAYEWAHVVAAPSVFGPNGRAEGIPNVMIEALAHQRPAIATRMAGIPELIEDQVTGLLVEPNDVDGLASALMNVKSDYPAAYHRAVEGRKFVKSAFDLQTNAQHQLDVFSTNQVGVAP